MCNEIHCVGAFHAIFETLGATSEFVSGGAQPEFFRVFQCHFSSDHSRSLLCERKRFVLINYHDCLPEVTMLFAIAGALYPVAMVLKGHGCAFRHCQIR